MNTIIWLVVGGLIGWAASVLLRTQEGVLLNVIVGVLGAALGGWLLSPIFGVSTINQSTFSAASLLVSLVGAVLLLAIVSFVLRRGPR
ncbi:MAG TPA: GlsB/YeaQ/YmgE family stress response membrane protein [Steroidobacteraceae bacterium]|nr:GlsB/YeaQ/YmgE family stress response membrane protein [Steroidobacteraceae bacterium]